MRTCRSCLPGKRPATSTSAEALGRNFCCLSEALRRAGRMIGKGDFEKPANAYGHEASVVQKPAACMFCAAEDAAAHRRGLDGVVGCLSGKGVPCQWRDQKQKEMLGRRCIAQSLRE